MPGGRLPPRASFFWMPGGIGLGFLKLLPVGEEGVGQDIGGPVDQFLVALPGGALLHVSGVAVRLVLVIPGGGHVWGGGKERKGQAVDPCLGQFGADSLG